MSEQTTNHNEAPVDDFTKKIMTYGQVILEQLVSGAQEDGVEPGELLYSIILAALNLTLSMSAGDREKSCFIMDETYKYIMDSVRSGEMVIVKGDKVLGEEKSKIVTLNG
jgi:hypothetical protein